ncbi:MAG: glycosyltransferase [Bacteroidales bacterium]|nr:glycosyltransferase [Bacteroidales bacterium]
MTPKVSFVVAVYGVESYIAQCAQTLFEQTLDDIEIVFVDDASPDKSVEIIEHLLEQYPNRRHQVKIVHHSNNKGLPEARKTGVGAASGEYLLLIDGDDYVEPQMAERTYQYAIEQGADMVLYDYYFNIGEQDLYTRGRWKDGNADSDQLRIDTLNRYCVPCVWSRLYKRALFLNDFAWPKCAMTEDVVLTSALTLASKKFVYLPEAFYHYRSIPNSISHSAGKAKDVARFEQSCTNLETLLHNMRLYNMEAACERGIVFTKMCAKNYLLQYSHKLKYRKLWFSTYPETVKLMWQGSDTIHTTWRERLWIVVIWLGLFPTMKRLMINKRFRPNLLWLGDLLRK